MSLTYDFSPLHQLAHVAAQNKMPIYIQDVKIYIQENGKQDMPSV